MKALFLTILLVSCGDGKSPEVENSDKEKLTNSGKQYEVEDDSDEGAAEAIEAEKQKAVNALALLMTGQVWDTVPAETREFITSEAFEAVSFKDDAVTYKLASDPENYSVTIRVVYVDTDISDPFGGVERTDDWEVYSVVSDGETRKMEY